MESVHGSLIASFRIDGANAAMTEPSKARLLFFSVGAVLLSQTLNCISYYGVSATLAVFADEELAVRAGGR